MFAVALLWAAVAPARGGTGSEATLPRPIAGHPVFEMRVGVDRVDELHHPFLCAEGTPLPWLSVEACGTGAGILHHDDAADMAHFRTRARLLGAQSGRGTLDWLVGGGFAEVQRTGDEPGFRFGKATSPEQVEAAGPELSASVKGRYYVDPGARAYLSADFNVGAAAIPAAPTVIGHGGPIVPFAALTVGLGF